MQIQGLADASLNPQQDAWECFWEGQLWKDILVWSQHYPEASQGQWQTVADFMVNMDATNSLTETIAHLAKLTRFVLSLPSLVSKRNDPTWQAVFDSYAKGIEDAIATADNFPISSDCLQLWQKGLFFLAKEGFARDRNFALAACCAYQDGRYDRAIAFWEKCNQESYREHNEYFISKAMLASTPENIYWFSRAQQLTRIVEVWQSKKHALSDEWKPYLEDLQRALEKGEQHKDLLEIDIQQSRWIRAVQRLKTRLGANDAAFDATLRLDMLRRMAKDKNLNFKAIQREAEQFIKITLKEAREALYKFVTETTQLQEWKAELNAIEEAGKAFDRIGEFLPALAFYERFRNDANKEVCELARSRWLDFKRKQANYSEQMGQLEKAQQQRQEADRTEQMWQCNPADAMRQRVRDRLENLSEDELKQVDRYILFLEFSRDLKSDRNN